MYRGTRLKKRKFRRPEAECWVRGARLRISEGDSVAVNIRRTCSFQCRCVLVEFETCEFSHHRATLYAARTLKTTGYRLHDSSRYIVRMNL